MSASNTSAPITSSEPSDQSALPQNLVVEKLANSTEPNVDLSKGRKPAWNIPSGKALPESECSVIYGATWPALAANTPSQASPKSSSTASSSSTDDKSLSNVSVVSFPPETTVVVPIPQQTGPNRNSNLMRWGSTSCENTCGPEPNNRSSRWAHSSNRCGYNNNNNNHHHHHNNNNNSGRSYRTRDRRGANWSHSWNNSSRPPYFYQANQTMTTTQHQPSISYGYGVPNIYPAYYTPMGYDYSHAMYGYAPLTVPQWVAPMAPGYGVEVLELRNSILKQIEYYFSIENLVKDTYLRKEMDEQGWVPISFVADFKRVKQLSSDLQFILESLNDSTVVEVQEPSLKVVPYLDDSIIQLYTKPLLDRNPPPSSHTIISYVLLAAYICAVGTTDYTVSDSERRTIIVNYIAWSSKYNFTIDDILLFNYVKGLHNVYEVTPDLFRLCNTTNNMLRIYDSGQHRHCKPDDSKGILVNMRFQRLLHCRRHKIRYKCVRTGNFASCATASRGHDFTATSTSASAAAVPSDKA